VLPAEAPQAAPDPVFVLAGGPGQAITEVYPQVSVAFERLRRDRDIVLVDQRGTGGSGRLTCPEA
jgi:pimeloyl-ACP methyl ester carboxylesterase